MSNDHALQSVMDRIKQLKAEKGTIGAEDIQELIAAVSKLVAGEREIYGEIRTIADKIQKAKAEVQALGGNAAGKDQISSANMELDEVIKATEVASNRIMDAAEKIQKLAKGNKEILALTTELFEACSFQDITGQRIRKVLTVMSELEGSISKLMQFASTHGVEIKGGPKVPQTEAEKAKALMSGPQLSGEKPSQDDIDKLFSSL